MSWRIVGPECPECEGNDGTVIGSYVAHDDDPPEQIMGQKIRCAQCRHSYDSWIDIDYDPEYPKYLSYDPDQPDLNL